MQVLHFGGARKAEERVNMTFQRKAEERVNMTFHLFTFSYVLGRISEVQKIPSWEDSLVVLVLVQKAMSCVDQ
jgi:hypothetical protein